MKCKYCGNTFSNKYNLTNHQKRAKYCLKIQNEERDDILYYRCEYCVKEFTLLCNLSRHEKICKKKDEKKCKDLEEKISKLEQKLVNKDKIITCRNKTIEKLQSEVKIYKELSEQSNQCVQDIAKQPHNITTNTTQNNRFISMTPFLLDNEKAKQLIEQDFGDDYLFSGQKGVARFVVDRLLKDEDGNLTYRCCDPSRETFKYKNKDGDIQKDIRAKKLTLLIEKDIKNKSYRMAREKTEEDPSIFSKASENALDISILDDDNAIFRKELATLTI